MEPVLGNRDKGISVYTIYTKHLEPPPHTLDSDENKVSPLLAGTEKSTIMLNPKSCLNKIVVLNIRKGGTLIILTKNREHVCLSCFNF